MIKFVACNQWRHKGLGEYQVSLFDIGCSIDKRYAQCDTYTLGVAVFGFACGFEVKIVNDKDLSND